MKNCPLKKEMLVILNSNADPCEIERDTSKCGDGEECCAVLILRYVAGCADVGQLKKDLRRVIKK